MKRFCMECGKEAGPVDKVCTHCGTPLSKGDNVTREKQLGEKETTKKRAPLPKKKKILFSVIGAVIVFIIAFSVWAQSYQSSESVEKRFAKAISSQDAVALQKLLVHEDGTSVKKGEAKALLKLVKDEGSYVAEDLFSVKKHGKFLFLFTAHKVEAVDQFAVFTDPIEGLAFLFNDIEVNEQKTDDEGIIYGPLVPGAYKIEAVFEGDYGSTKKADTMRLYDSYGEKTWIDMHVNISEVVFQVENYGEFDTEKSFIKLGDEEIPLNKDGYTKSVGPFILDGSQKVQTVVSMPWGEVKSESFAIDAPEMWIRAELLTDEHLSGVEKVLKNFGEQYVESMANKNTKPLKSVSDKVKKVVADMIREDWYYSGKFEQVAIDRYGVQVDNSSKQPQIGIIAEYTFNAAYHELEEEPDFYEDVARLSLDLSYDKEKKAWEIVSVKESDYWGDFEATDTVKGSKKIHGPSEEAITTAKNAAQKEDITYFLEDYTRASVSAINYSDFDYVSDYIVPDSPRWDEAKDYIDYLDDKGITEDFLEMEVESVEEKDDNTWEVTIKESFTIHKPDNSSDKTFRTKVVVKKVENEYMVYELIETNEI